MIRGNTAGPPGTGRRTGTAGIRTAAGVGIGLNTNVEVMGNHVSREGMVGTANPALRGATLGRQVQDKTYYLGTLRQMTKDLQDEIENLGREEESIKNHSIQSEQYKQRGNILAKEITDLQLQLRDLNLAIQKLHEHEESDIVEELKQQKTELEEKNNVVSQENNMIYQNRKSMDEQIQAISSQLHHYQAKIEEKLTQNHEKRGMYYTLKEEKSRLIKEQEAGLHNLRVLQEDLEQMKRDTTLDPQQQRVLQRLDEKTELETRKNKLEKDLAILSENEGDISASLIGQVKHNKQCIKDLSEEINVKRTQIEGLTNEIRQIRSKVQSFSGEGAKRYQELLNRDKLLQDYIDNFSSTRTEDEKNLREHQELIVKVLEYISQGIKDQELIPSVDKFNELNENLKFKEEQTGFSESTLLQLERELQLRQKELETMKRLPEKLEQSLQLHRKRIEQMKTELIEYRDIDGMRERTEQTKQDLEKQREDMTKLRDSMKQHVHLQNRKNEHLKKSLASNDIYNAHSDLEQRIRVYEQNNFALKDFITQKTAETDYREVKSHSLNLVSELNKILGQQSMSTNISM